MTNLDIETFWAVVHHGTMTAAAESLYITQPTLSMRIRALEERVGTPLFVRGKGQRHIALTEAGQKFLTLAQRWQQLLAETDSLAELGQREYLRIAATYTTNQYILPPVYKRFLAQGLPVSLWIHTLRDVDSAQLLLQQRFFLRLGGLRHQQEQRHTNKYKNADQDNIALHKHQDAAGHNAEYPQQHADALRFLAASQFFRQLGICQLLCLSLHITPAFL